MIVDLQRFAATEQPFWVELERQLDELERSPDRVRALDELRRFHYLYERASAGLAKLAGFAAEPETRRFLETLVARAYGEIHETRRRSPRLSLARWFLQTLPITFRRHAAAFWVAFGITLAGALFGGLAVAFDPEAKGDVLPQMFASHLNDPAERVAREEANPDHPGAGAMSTFSAQLMVNNISVSIRAMAFGMTYGLGTIILLFYNGVILGVVAVDYVLAGQLKFLLAWLLPHGVIELPAVMMGGQAGLILARALIGRGQNQPIRARLRAVSGDVVTLIFGIALLLVWAGLIEAFFSQYHQPVIPYSVKIAFGCTELVLFVAYLSQCGRSAEADRRAADLETSPA